MNLNPVQLTFHTNLSSNIHKQFHFNCDYPQMRAKVLSEVGYTVALLWLSVDNDPGRTLASVVGWQTPEKCSAISAKLVTIALRKITWVSSIND